MRRLVRWLFVTVAAGSFAIAAATPASAAASARGQATCPDKHGCVRAVTINGFIDEINVDFIQQAVAETNDIDGYRAIVIVIDSPGSVVSGPELDGLIRTLRDSKVPVSAWIGPSGASVRGGAAELVTSIPFTMAPNTEIGGVIAPVSKLSPVAGQSNDAAELQGRIFNEKAAKSAGLIPRVDPTLGDHVLGIKGVPSKVVKDKEGREKREMLVTGVTQKLPVTIQLLHTAASPGVAYLALGIAIGLLLFEFFTAGVGVAGVVGAIAAVLAGYGLAELPIRPWALGLCLFSAFAFAIDIQTAIPRAWTFIGLACWTVGSVFLFDGFRAPWLALLTGLGGMAVTMLSGMPAMVRSRFATPTLGRDWMIGKEGTAATDIDPEGTVTVAGGQWRALTNRATPLAKGDPLRVVSIDGLTLEVEPLEGGARDYRERRSKDGSAAVEAASDS